MEVNPFENPQKRPKDKLSRNPESISNITTRKNISSQKRYNEFVETKNEFYKQKFDVLESQIEDFQRKSNREKYINKFKNEEDKQNSNFDSPQKEEVFEREKIIINNKGNGCGAGCNPFSVFGKLKCCGCLFIMLVAIGAYLFLATNNRFVQDFTIGNILPNLIGNIDTSQIPNQDFFSISDRLKSEVKRIEESPNQIESFTVYDSELNTYLREQNFTFSDYPTEQYVTFDENRMNIFIKRKDKNDSWLLFKLQSDKLGKPQVISVQYGKFDLSGEVARNFLNNLPLNVGNINFEKLDGKFSELLFLSGNNTIDKIVFSKGRADISVVRK